MQKHWLYAVPVLVVAYVSAAPAVAAEGRGQPFITAAYYQKNITLDQFKVNPRSYFRSEDAFRLIVRYVGDEIGKPDLTAAEFIALMRDDTQTQVRACAVGERINTGAYEGGQFHWFIRSCRPGEKIVQVRGKDMFSLNCLNAVEDKTPAPPPRFTYVTPPPPIAPQLPQKTVTVVTTPGILVPGSIFTIGCVCCGQQQIFGTSPTYIPGSTIVSVDFGF